MTNSFLKKRGAITLILTVVLIVTSTLILIFSANFSQTQQKIVANLTRQSQAFEAASAGMEYAINYLQQNSTAILANPVSGFIPAFSNSNTTNVTLANNSRYSFVYSNPVAGNYNLIQITSTGTNSDNSSTRVIKQLVHFGSLLATVPNSTFITRGSFALGGNARIINTNTNSTIQAGTGVSLNGSAATVTSSGTSSTPGNMQSDIQQNNAALQSISQADLFATYFGAPMASVKSQSANVYTNSSDFNYSSTLNNKTGTSIWIEQTGGTARINGTTIIGSALAPVLLIVNGDLDIKGNVVIYGMVYVIGGGSADADITGNALIYGSMITTGNVSIAGNMLATYSPSVLSNLQNQPSMRYWAKVAGSWRDY